MRRLLPLVLVTAFVLASCGGGSGETSTTEDPAAAARATAQHVVFHAYDFPGGWREIDISQEPANTRFDMQAEVNACLTPPIAPVGKAENLWMQSPPVAARSLAAVLKDDTVATAALKELSGDAFRDCFRQRVFDFIKKTLPPEQLQPDLVVETKPITLGVNGVDYEMRATPITPGGPSAYVGFVFLQNRDIVAMLNFFSTAAFPPAIQGALVRSVADRMH